MSTDSFMWLESPPRVRELERLGDEIAELSAHLDAATARLLALIREFDARGGWNTGFRSCAEWLGWRVGLTLGAARERVRVAHALGALPGLAAALARGELSYAKVRALTRVATPETEARLLRVGRAGTAAHVERLVRAGRRVDRRAEAREAARQHASRGLRLSHDEDGTVVIRGRLTPEAGALLLRALDAARETLYQRARRGAADCAAAEPAPAAPTRGQPQADALVLLAETALDQDLDPGAPGERYQVVVHVDAAVLADPAQDGQTALDGGIRVSAETSQRLACDASRVVMRHDPGRAGGRGRRLHPHDPPGPPAGAAPSRSGLSIPGLRGPRRRGASRTALGAGRPDHADEPRVALPAASSRGARGGLPRDARPGGRVLLQPPGWPRAARRAATGSAPDEPVAALRSANEARQVQIGPRTGCARWLGERLDLGWAIDVLHPGPREVARPAPPSTGSRSVARRRGTG
jgi:hypothetical protein